MPMPMVQSDTLPQDAVKYLNDLREQKNREAEQAGRRQALDQLLHWSWQWFQSARDWRKASYEEDWIRWQRAADGRFDPEVAKKKKDWQAKAHVDLTASHRENIHAELFRLRAGARPIVDVSPRPGGDPAQAENIRDLVAREFDKTEFENEDNKGLYDKTTYGSSFARCWYDTKYQDKVFRQPIKEPLNSIGALKRSMTGQAQIVGYSQQTVSTLVYRGMRIKHISIWDFFKDPKGLTIENHPCAVRGWITLQEILDGVKRGEFMPESAVKMSQSASNEVSPSDKSLLETERGISSQTPHREGNQKTWEYYELYAQLPQKWVYPLLRQPMQIDDAEKLVAARVCFTQSALFYVELNDDYDGQPPFYQDDYLHVPNKHYGIGICEQLKNHQMVVNAVVNQRLDEGTQALEEKLAVIEKAVSNPAELEAGGPGLIVRMNQKALGPNGDVRNAIMPLGRPDVKINAGFLEVHEWERMAQERTGANKVELVSPGRFQGGNRTLGGQQLLKNQAEGKFAFIAMTSEFKYLKQLFRAFWKGIYKNLQPQDVLMALGPERAKTFQLMSPEEIELAYKFEAKGVFEREAKAETHARLAAVHEDFKGAPWLSELEIFDAECKAFGVNPELLKVPQSAAIEIMGKAQQMAEPMAKKMLMDMVMGQAAKDFEKNIAELLAERAADKAEGKKEGAKE